MTAALQLLCVKPNDHVLQHDYRINQRESCASTEASTSNQLYTFACSSHDQRLRRHYNMNAWIKWRPNDQHYSYWKMLSKRCFFYSLHIWSLSFDQIQNTATCWNGVLFLLMQGSWLLAFSLCSVQLFGPDAGEVRRPHSQLSSLLVLRNCFGRHVRPCYKLKPQKRGWDMYSLQ